MTFHSNSLLEVLCKDSLQDNYDRESIQLQ